MAEAKPRHEEIVIAILISAVAGLNFGLWQNSVYAGMFMLLVVYSLQYLIHAVSITRRDE